MSAVTAAAAVAAASAASASLSASNQSRKKTEKCKATIDGFDSDNANTKQKQEYAECVSVLHHGHSDIQKQKDVISSTGGLFLLVFAIMCVVNKIKNGGNHDWMEILFESVIAFISLIMAGTFIWSLT